MSLKDYQNAYTSLFFDKKMLDSWFDKNYQGLDKLSPDEQKAIKNFPEDIIGLVQNSTFNGRHFVFLNSIPDTIGNFLSESDMKDFVSYFIVKYPEWDIQPKGKYIASFLKIFLEKLKSEQELPKHLEDIFNFEITRASLYYYQYPKTILSRGPRLASWVGLFLAGEHFEEVFNKLSNKEDISNLPDKPKNGYLLSLTPNHKELKKIHWSFYEILINCNGQKTWEELVDNLIEKEDLIDQKKSLMDWEKEFIKEGILLPGLIT